ncbi:adhesion G protein-coupled receptor L2, partial [Biomphalaria glabrata]
LLERLNRFSKKLVQYIIQIDLVEFLTKPGQTLLFLLVKMSIQIKVNEPRNVLERELMSAIFKPEAIVILSDENNLKLKPFFILLPLQFEGKIDQLNSSHCNDTTLRINSNKTEDDTLENPYYTYYKAARLNQLLICRHVRLDQSYFHLIIDDHALPSNVTVVIHFNTTKIQITDNEDLIMLDVDAYGNLLVCVDLIDMKLKELKESDPDSEKLIDRKLKERDPETEKPSDNLCEETQCLIENILTWICFIISIVCLLLTLLTYCMFPVLRTKAGVNNMFLSLSLLLAQVSLMISAYTSAPSIPCKIIGVMTHFLWLWNFSWNFICSYHMFRVFTNSRRVNNQQTMTRGTWKRLSGSFVLPVTDVIAVITYSHFTTMEREFGYGNVRCYLDSPFLIGIAVAAPLFVITLINVIFFLVTVYKIYSVQSLQSASFSKSAPDFNKTIYVKLSTVTGMFWIVAVLAELSDNAIFGFIALVLNGLQGVAIFYAFVCNKRVVALYSTSWRQPEA